MNKAANSYWTDARLSSQRPVARALALPSPARPRALPGGASVRQRSTNIPPWVFFCMVIFATFAVCVTVTVRTRAEMRASAEKYEQMTTDVERLRNTNAAIRQEVERLRTDPRAIEAAARARLGLVRPDEIVVPVE